MQFSVVAHVNPGWTSLHEIPYERFNEGTASVLVSNGTTASYVPPHHILKTQAFQVPLPVYQSCPHFVQLGTCMHGAMCGLVHPIQLRPLLPSIAYTQVVVAHPNGTLTPMTPMWTHPNVMSQTLMVHPSIKTQFTTNSFNSCDAPLSASLMDEEPRILRFSNSRQRRGNKPLIVPAAAVGDKEPGPRQLIVNYLAPRVDTVGLRQLFEAFGEVEDALVVTDQRNGASRGFGFVLFKRSVDALTAINGATGRVLLGKRVRIGYLNPQYPMNEGLTLADIALTLEALLSSDAEDSHEVSAEPSLAETTIGDSRVDEEKSLSGDDVFCASTQLF